MGKGARTKGYIKNLATGQIKSFLYNPSSFSTSRSVNIGEITAPGCSYPRFQYISGGAKTINIDLFLYGNNDEVNSYKAFLNSFLPVESAISFKTPPMMLFAFGSYMKKCVLEGFDEEYVSFHDDLRPKQMTIKLTLKVV